MSQTCPEYLSKISDVLENGMTIAMSIWTGPLEWLHHNRCDASQGCGRPDLKFKNFKFTTEDADNGRGDVNDGQGDGDSDDSGSGAVI